MNGTIDNKQNIEKYTIIYTNRYIEIKKEMIGFGTYRLNGSTYDATLHAIQSGIRMIDTAPLYGNIVEVGNAIKNNGNNNVIVTAKISRDSLESFDVVNSIKDTMKKMGINYIHEVILHEPINYKENWKLLSDFYQMEGKNLIGKIGVSNFNQEHLQDILDDKTTLNPSVNQIEINPFLTRGSLPEYCKNNNIDIVAHSPLAKGELLNKQELIDIADIYNVSPAQIMLQWGIQNGYRVIPRSSDFKHIEENVSLNFTIHSEDMARLNNLNCGYSTHPKYLTPEEKKIFNKLRTEYKKKRKKGL